MNENKLIKFIKSVIQNNDISFEKKEKNMNIFNDI